ncbi:MULTISPECIES: nucleotide pyrophosphohydrolase [Sporosarcina]|uniref:Nucleotide pyrophosphohydrolase n=1 Tax=Sporosarcina saromensis TaxID=359365 RepID=A0ABU4GD36_9BACL|nr:nucleotide pyrophosphohydrolase [Sporosarcina saromensis]MDW0114233.1 nucleotide pyrophosphohydrolase [Sporosarcina saromensis]
MEQLQEALRKFSEERGWTGNRDARNLAISISLEASELLEHFQWQSPEEAVAARRDEIAEEAADVLIYLVQFADALNIDLLEAARAKMAKNAERFPIG